MSGNGQPVVERISLLDSLDKAWFKLPHAAMIDVGPATQTLAGLLQLTKRETFSPVSLIAGQSRLPVATVRKHLRTLDTSGWIKHKGRERTRRGYPRRTATIAITEKTRSQLEPYAVLPWWACCHVRHVGRLSWSTKAVLSIIMGRLMSLKAVAEREDGHGLDADDVAGSIDDLGGEDRFAYSLRRLEKMTGLTRDSIATAKASLHGMKIVEWREASATQHCDLLVPNWEFEVVQTPTTPGYVVIDFASGRKLVNGWSKSG